MNKQDTRHVLGINSLEHTQNRRRKRNVLDKYRRNRKSLEASDRTEMMMMMLSVSVSTRVTRL